MSESCSESESEYEMMTHRQEMLDKRKRLDKIKRKRQKVNIGNWSLEENLKYKTFLENNLALFQTGASVRRLVKVNVMISQEVGTRSSDQCRSHHQKMIKYHTSIEGVIAHVHLLQSMHADESEMGEGNLPLRIRKKVSRSETEEQMCKVEEEEKDLWDVLCFEGSGLGFEQHL